MIFSFYHAPRQNARNLADLSRDFSRGAAKTPPATGPEAAKQNPVSALADELFPAAGTGDGDLALTPGNPDSLAALRAIEIAMLPVLDPVDERQEFPVFLVSLVGLPGEAAVQRPHQQRIIRQGEAQPDPPIGNKDADDHNDHRCPQKRHIQLVGTVTAGHEPLKPLRDFFHEA